ncbi:XRE family transcriptional regulator [Lysinibacillus capsici]|uniref:LexA family protein n=1 Tax=Lysinibacillus capsici TaxID=2115968 RepID=UPI002E1F92F7|nr:XRE family transcriptional regulator [Lysinibacillus capsici]
MKDTTKLVFSKNLETLLSKTDKTVSDLSNDLGISYSTVSDWKNGKKMPRGGSLQALADYFNVNLSSLLEEKSTNLIELPQPTSEYTYFPVHASAGLPIQIDCVTDAETITLPDAILGKYAGDDEIFFMRVNGDSMNKVIPHKSLIGLKPIQVKDLKNGDIIVYSDGYSYSVKRFYRDGERLIFRPESYDASFTDYTVIDAYDDLRLHGKVVTYIVNLD